ncbi:ferredoxin domain-containing protein [Anoxynatronum sibiricum]|uniref:DUF2148 domain-containing protein n=1 Tax=Anoxynatronum sibiricum TaxID=210623 RepID=A0ABU9VXX0_9CLOT
MIYKSKELEKQAAMQVAQLMAAAARTAPKGKGADRLEMMVLDGTDKETLSQEMRRIAEDSGAAFFQRDAGNVDDSQVVLLIGTRNGVAGVPVCGFCGFKNCAENVQHNGICAFATGDLGIAVGSAVSVAADHRCDNRIMFSAGKAALNLGYFGDDVIIAYGIPLAIKGKSPFFDRG